MINGQKKVDVPKTDSGPATIGRKILDINKELLGGFKRHILQVYSANMRTFKLIINLHASHFTHLFFGRGSCGEWKLPAKTEGRGRQK